MADSKTSSARFTANLRQFIQFGIVGGSGTIVNLVVAALSKKIAEWGWGVSEHDAFMNILGSQFHVRWYHVFRDNRIFGCQHVELSAQPHVDVQECNDAQLVAWLLPVPAHRGWRVHRQPDRDDAPDEPKFADFPVAGYLRRLHRFPHHVLLGDRHFDRGGDAGELYHQ